MKRIRLVGFTSLLLLLGSFTPATYAQVGSEREALNVPNYLRGVDLFSFTFDHAPDKDDGHAAAAAYSMSETLGLSPLVISGAVGDGNRHDFIPASIPLMDDIWGPSSWLDAFTDWNASVVSAGDTWINYLNNGGYVFIAEGGQADFTADVLRYVKQRIDLTPEKIVVVQHSRWNEVMSNQIDLAYVQENATYIKLDDGNFAGNNTADLNMDSSTFHEKAMSGPFSLQWKAAFEYWTPGNRVDFSDVVEALWILDIPLTIINEVDDFAELYLAKSKGDLYEFDNSIGSAGLISVGETQARSLHSSFQLPLINDIDYVEFNIEGSESLLVTISTDGLADDDFNTVLSLYDTNRNVLAVDDDNGRGFFSTIQTALAPGTYFIEVASYELHYKPDYTLSLETEPLAVIDNQKPTITTLIPTAAGPSELLRPGSITIAGTASDNVAIARNSLMVRNRTTEQYWDGTTWTDTWVRFDLTHTDDWDNDNWSYSLTLPAGEFLIKAWSWDTSDNLGKAVARSFSVIAPDTAPPVISIDPIASTTAGLVTVNGNSVDNVAIAGNSLMIRNKTTEQYWDGTTWTDTWVRFNLTHTDDWDNDNWFYSLTLPAGDFLIKAWSWDTSDNLGKAVARSFSVIAPDTAPPVISIDPIASTTAGLVTVNGNSVDNVAIAGNSLMVRNKTTNQYWDGTTWTDTWARFDLTDADDRDTGNWSYSLTLPVGNILIRAWAWDSSKNQSAPMTIAFKIE